jgi:hypothetical protein
MYRDRAWAGSDLRAGPLLCRLLGPLRAGELPAQHRGLPGLRCRERARSRLRTLPEERRHEHAGVSHVSGSHGSHDGGVDRLQRAEERALDLRMSMVILLTYDVNYNVTLVKDATAAASADRMHAARVLD